MTDDLNRRLAAFLAADVVGYTRLMESNSARTVASWRKARDELINPAINSFSGRIVKFMGDGFLAEFSTVQDAVNCAVALQKSFAKASLLEFRMGVNIGDIVDDGIDIYGEGINIATRLEGKAESGCICISSSVYEQIKNSLNFRCEDLGEQGLKNVSAPVKVYQIAPPFEQDDSSADVPRNKQRIGFCSSSDGIKIAYATIGQGPPVVVVGNWLTHLELDLKFPSRKLLVEMLAKNHEVIRYDARGNGLSELQPSDMSFETSVLDLGAVVSELGLENFALIGQSQGAAIAAAFAARYPEKVSKLVLYGGYARGRRMRGSEGGIAESDAFITMIQQGWGKDIDTYVQMFGTIFMPDANTTQLAGFTKLQRLATPPENAARIQLEIDSIDISDELPDIRVPTLVLHVREDARSSFEEGRRMATAIPKAKFIPLPGRNHVLLPGEIALTRYLEEIDQFINS